MTKLELTSQLMDLSIAGYFNGEKFSLKRLNTYLGALCRNDGDKLYMRIALPDGEWLFKIIRYSTGDWDYYIPDTREPSNLLQQKVMTASITTTPQMRMNERGA